MLPAEILGIHSIRSVGQALLSGIVTGSSYALLGAAFALIVGVTRRFHFAFGIVYAMTAYLAAVAVGDWGLPLAAAAAIGLGVAIGLAIVIEAAAYQPLARRAGENSLLAAFVASLGLMIAGENLIRLVWGNDTRLLSGFPQHAFTVAGLNFTLLELTLVVIAVPVLVGLSLLLSRTLLGQQILAVRDNPELARAMGVHVEWTFLAVFAMGTLIGGIAALFDGMRFAVTPDMGNTPVFYAFVVAFVAGTQRSPIVVGAAGLAIGILQSVSTLWVSDNQSALTVFGLLFAVLSVRSIPNALRQLAGAVVRPQVRRHAEHSRAS